MLRSLVGSEMCIRDRCWTVGDPVKWNVVPARPSPDGCVEQCKQSLADPANQFVYVSIRGDRPEMLSVRWRSVPKDTFTTRVDMASDAQMEALASVALIPGTMLVEFKRLAGHESDYLAGFRVRVFCRTGMPDYGSVPKLKLLDRSPIVRPPPPVAVTDTATGIDAPDRDGSETVTRVMELPGRREALMNKSTALGSELTHQNSKPTSLSLDACAGSTAQLQRGASLGHLASATFLTVLDPNAAEFVLGLPSAPEQPEAAGAMVGAPTNVVEAQ
eukprot:TRINITY_DN54523_c0_g1_i1.p1 TRINITY_DN54523_c0_g1~~TRINITY_DN54523_c0_g1_i1.p1  ORF type:complete len:318 (-),score=40.71 TRINITY_DN54523_c0_g1_i1:87-908(-)